ncbi:retinal short-chain dehydrogenase/reductase [Clavulina sp. PMI_390]|nr:retinal short-chain dehydrogenase/reductase [Clavulina sp. PMI_390]
MNYEDDDSSTNPLAPSTVPFNTEPSLVFDALDIDLVLKVLKNTAFSPFFTFFIPILSYAQRGNAEAPTVVWGSVWFVLVTLFWIFSFSSTAWRNGMRSERVEWEDQIVLITGGASGVGELLANTLAVRNVTVIVLDIKTPFFDNDNINFYKCDVSNWEEVEAVAKQIVDEIGHPTVIINNAGVVQGKTVIDLDEKDVKQTMGVNVLAHFWTLKAFLPEMIKQKSGHVVTVSSTMGYVGAGRLADYVASKHALIGLHESLRYELDNVHNTPRIRTTLLAPGYMQTALFSRSQYGSPNPPSALPAWLFRFLAPQLAPHEVVKRVIAAIDLHQSQDILMPFFVNVSQHARLLPSWGRDALQWISGADHIMEGFVKVSGRREDEGPVPEVRSNGSGREKQD